MAWELHITARRYVVAAAGGNDMFFARDNEENRSIS
jgi:hypothetical protein